MEDEVTTADVLRGALMAERADPMPSCDPNHLRALTRVYLRDCGEPTAARAARILYEAVMYRRLGKIIKLAAGNGRRTELKLALHEERLWRAITEAYKDAIESIKTDLNLEQPMPEEVIAEL